MKNEKKLAFNPGPWGAFVLTIVYLLVMDLYFHYCLNSEVDLYLQVGAVIAAVYYTWWQLRLIVTIIIERLIKKEEKEK